MAVHGTRMLVNLHDYEAAAREVVPPAYFQFVAGGADDHVTLDDCRAAFNRWRLVPRVMQGIAEASLATTVLGHPLSMPVLVAPMGLHGLMHGEGEVATAGAARRAGVIFTLATSSSRTIEEAAAPAGTFFYQVYLYRDRGISRELIQRAVAAGAAALVLTVDVPVSGNREADVRNDFEAPRRSAMAHFAGGLFAVEGTGREVPERRRREVALTFHDIEWLASLTGLPVIVKGVLHPEDARLCVQHGARGIVVSNHGGRQLDGAIASIDGLPDIVEAVQGDAEVLIDGGFRRGTDVLKALALGARAIMLGRPVLFGLAVDGEDGALRVLELLRAELARAMMLSGVGDVNEVPRSLVRG